MEKLKNNLNVEYFEKPPSKFWCKIKLSKFQFEQIEIIAKSCVYLSPNTSYIDKYLIARCIQTKFVFLNKKTVTRISNGITEKEQSKILNEIKILVEQGYSISIITNEYPTIFGNNENISKNLAVFLAKTKLDIKFLTFPGEYFTYPIWAEKPRHNKIYACQQITIPSKQLDGCSQKEIEETFKKNNPSSASIYLKKYPVMLRQNDATACNLEQILYCCPECNSFFSLYSEYSCIKCKECSSAFELSQDGKILFSKKLKTFDDIENFNYNSLTKKGFEIKCLIRYENIKLMPNINAKKSDQANIALEIYAEYFKVIIDEKKYKKYKFEDIESIDLEFNNTIIIKQKNANIVIFRGNNKENLLILKDLLRLNKN